MLMGRPDYFDEPIHGFGGSAWFYWGSIKSEIIAEWDSQGRVGETILLR
jgi:hypothetical protein